MKPNHKEIHDQVMEYIAYIQDAIDYKAYETAAMYSRNLSNYLFKVHNEIEEKQ